MDVVVRSDGVRRGHSDAETQCVYASVCVGDWFDSQNQAPIHSSIDRENYFPHPTAAVFLTVEFIPSHAPVGATKQTMLSISVHVVCTRPSTGLWIT